MSCEKIKNSKTKKKIYRNLSTFTQRSAKINCCSRNCVQFCRFKKKQNEYENKLGGSYVPKCSIIICQKGFQTKCLKILKKKKRKYLTFRIDLAMDYVSLIKSTVVDYFTQLPNCCLDKHIYYENYDFKSLLLAFLTH